MHLNRQSVSCVAVLSAFALIYTSKAHAQCGIACPPYSVPAGPNLVKNPNFEIAGPCGTFAWTAYGSSNCGGTSASADWKLHGDNFGHPVRSYFVAPSDLPIAGYSGMLRIIAAGNESGVYQLLPPGLTKVVASVWVKVMKGHVAFQTNGGTTGPVSWSTKTNEWELLRVCTDGTVPIDMFVIYNQDPAGGEFYIDRAEVIQVP